MRLKRLGIALLAILSISISGCTSLPGGAGRRPIIEVGAPPVYGIEERAVLDELAKRYPELAKKIIGRNNELKAAIDAYNERAVAFNRELMKVVGFTDKEVDALYPAVKSK